MAKTMLPWIQGNCGNWVYINSTDDKTNRYFSGLLDTETLEYTTYNSENGDILNRTKMSHQKSREIMRKSELWRMPEVTWSYTDSGLSRFIQACPNITRWAVLSLRWRKSGPRNLFGLTICCTPYPHRRARYAGHKPQEAKAAEERGQRMLVQASINNLNILTGAVFSQAVDSRDPT